MSADTDRGRSGASSSSSPAPFPSIDRLWRSADAEDLQVAARDSADGWVWARGDRAKLLALSGAVPFNGEPPLTDLAAQLVTPTQLHHVRNHGPVPRIDEQQWKLEIRMEEGDSHSQTDKKKTEKPAEKGAEQEPEKGAEKGKEKQPEKEGDTAKKSGEKPTEHAGEKSGEKKKDDPSAEAETHPAPPSSRVLRSWTLSELRALPSTSLLVTLSCDGIRRKELNKLGPHTKGINTGPAATGTSLWTGVLLRDVMRLSGVEVEQVDGEKESAAASAKSASSLPEFTVFTGLDSPAKGAYGTSLPSLKALDPRRSSLLAWAQNGEPLTPDHGAPLRLIVPGYVGGRSVKWLGSITLSHSQSRSHYHNEDNMRLPTEVGIATWNGGSHTDGPDYRLYEQCVNSVIAHPTHEEWLEIESLAHTSVPVSGFATAGGGRRIMRVEVSTDGGASWRSAEITHADSSKDEATKDKGSKPDTQKAGSKSDPPAHSSDAASAARSPPRPGTPCWSWCFWHLDLPAVALLSSPVGPSLGKSRDGPKEIVVRASDEACNSQGPSEYKLTRIQGKAHAKRNWYRVNVQTRLPSGPTGPVFLRFQHPVLPGAAEGGWMKQGAAPHQTRISASPVSRAGPLLGLAAHRAHKLISAAEVAQHASRDDCWIVLDSTVYDVTPYMRDHPGGAEALLAATRMPHAKLEELFTSIHARDAEEITGRFAIGVLAPQALIDALSSYHFDRAPEPSKDRPQLRRQRSFIRLEPDASDKEVSGAKLALSSSKEGIDREEHRRSHWQEQPSPKLAHPLRSDIAWFPPHSSKRRFLLHSTRWCAIRLMNVVSLNHDTKLFTFCAARSERAGDAAPSFDSIGLTTGQHLLLGAMVGEEFVVRPYTPTRPTGMDDEDPKEGAGQQEHSPAAEGKEGNKETKPEREETKDAAATGSPPAHSSPSAASPASGSSSPPHVSAVSTVSRSATFDLVVKIYRRHGLMPGGKLTTFLDTLTPETKAVLRVKGPTGHVRTHMRRCVAPPWLATMILYLGSGYFNIHGASVRVRRINLIGGGTGITPLWQLFNSLLHPASTSDSESVSVSLVYANKTAADILLRRELEELAEANRDRARIVHVLSRNDKPKEKDRDHQGEGEEHKHGNNENHESKEETEHASAEPPAHADTDQGGDSASSPSAVSIASGRVSAYLFRRHLFPPSSSTLTFVCGPPPMQDAAHSALQALGFDEQDVVEF